MGNVPIVAVVQQYYHCKSGGGALVRVVRSMIEEKTALYGNYVVNVFFDGEIVYFALNMAFCAYLMATEAA